MIQIFGLNRESKQYCYHVLFSEIEKLFGFEKYNNFLKWCSETRNGDFAMLMDETFSNKKFPNQLIIPTWVYKSFK